jgi:hypothetical protein
MLRFKKNVQISYVCQYYVDGYNLTVLKYESQFRSLTTRCLHIGRTLDIRAFSMSFFLTFRQRILIIVILQHLLPLPGFLLLGQNIYDHFMSALQSDPLTFQTAFGEINLVPNKIATFLFVVEDETKYAPERFFAIVLSLQVCAQNLTAKCFEKDAKG